MNEFWQRSPDHRCPSCDGPLLEHRRTALYAHQYFCVNHGIFNAAEVQHQHERRVSFGNVALGFAFVIVPILIGLACGYVTH